MLALADKGSILYPAQSKHQHVPSSARDMSMETCLFALPSGCFYVYLMGYVLCRKKKQNITLDLMYVTVKLLNGALSIQEQKMNRYHQSRRELIMQIDNVIWTGIKTLITDWSLYHAYESNF